MDYLSHIFTIAFFATGITLLIRETPLGKRHVKQEKKPIACDLCMAFWTIFFTGPLFYIYFPTNNVFTFLFWQVAPAFAPAMWLIKNLSAPPIPPFGEDSEDG